ncbi:MAG TPA: GNAT family N-acetyltransferase, partial [Thermoguttaceae bacterium]|nr:GNAT family N-acetyltransferase [Thermoguttaceae bacterium]
GRPAAAEYQFVGDGVIYAYQSGIDPTRLDLQPGHALQLAVLAWAIRNGYRAYDFLRGDESYKSHWNARRRDSLTIRIVARHPSAQLRHAVWVAGVEARQWIRRGMDHLKQH